MKEPLITVTWQTLVRKPQAERLAKQLKLPIAKSATEIESSLYSLCVAEDHLVLILNSNPGTRNSNPSTSRLCTDFVKGPLGYRRQKGGGKNQAIAKAVGLKSYSLPLTVLDVTAGLGRDAFILATLGCTVTLVERSPVISALLLDGIERAKQDLEVAKIIQRMDVKVADARAVLKELSTDRCPDVIYLDPMFPSKTKSALNKIEMRMIRDLVGSNLDATELFELALSRAKKRVVVKRAAQSPAMTDLPPSFVIPGKSNRYDIYLR